MRQDEPAQAAGRSRSRDELFRNMSLGQVGRHNINTGATATALASDVLGVVLAARVANAVVLGRPVIQNQVPSVTGEAERQTGSDRPPPADTSHQHRSAA
jgi:hypothetical protein